MRRCRISDFELRHWKSGAMCTNSVRDISLMLEICQVPGSQPAGGDTRNVTIEPLPRRNAINMPPCWHPSEPCDCLEIASMRSMQKFASWSEQPWSRSIRGTPKLQDSDFKRPDLMSARRRSFTLVCQPRPEARSASRTSGSRQRFIFSLVCSDTLPTGRPLPRLRAATVAVPRTSEAGRAFLKNPHRVQPYRGLGRCQH